MDFSNEAALYFFMSSHWGKYAQELCLYSGCDVFTTVGFVSKSSSRFWTTTTAIPIIIIVIIIMTIIIEFSRH